MVISDSSTLIHLASIGRLVLLREFFGQIVIPPAVWREVVEQGQERFGSVEVAQARQDTWIEIQSATNEPLLRLLKHDLDTDRQKPLHLPLSDRLS